MTVPPGLTPRQRDVWQAADVLQGGDRGRPVSWAEIGLALSITPAAVRSSVRAMEKAGIPWLFPRAAGGQSSPLYRQRQSLVRPAGVPSGGPREDRPTPEVFRKAATPEARAAAAQAEDARACQRYLKEWKQLRRSAAERGGR